MVKQAPRVSSLCSKEPRAQLGITPNERRYKFTTSCGLWVRPLHTYGVHEHKHNIMVHNQYDSTVSTFAQDHSRPEYPPVPVYPLFAFWKWQPTIP